MVVAARLIHCGKFCIAVHYLSPGDRSRASGYRESVPAAVTHTSVSNYPPPDYHDSTYIHDTGSVCLIRRRYPLHQQV